MSVSTCCSSPTGPSAAGGGAAGTGSCGGLGHGSGGRRGGGRRLGLLVVLDRGDLGLRRVDRRRVLEVDDQLLVLGRLRRRRPRPRPASPSASRCSGRAWPPRRWRDRLPARGGSARGPRPDSAGARTTRRARCGPWRARPGCPRPPGPTPASRGRRRGPGRRPGSAPGYSAPFVNSRRVTAVSTSGATAASALSRFISWTRTRREEQPRRLGVGVERERLLRGPDGLRALAHLELRLGHQPQALARARRRLEHGHRGRRILLREQRAHEVALRLDVVGRKLERLLKDLRGLVVRAALQEHRPDQAVLHHGLVLLVGGAVEVRQPDLDPQVGGIDLRHLLVDGDRVGDPVVLLVVVGEDLVLAPGVLDQALLVVEVGEPVVHLEPGGVDLVDLLVDRDRLEEEPVLRIEVGDPLEIRESSRRAGSSGRTGPPPC